MTISISYTLPSSVQIPTAFGNTLAVRSFVTEITELIGINNCCDNIETLKRQNNDQLNDFTSIQKQMTNIENNDIIDDSLGLPSVIVRLMPYKQIVQVYEVLPVFCNQICLNRMQNNYHLCIGILEEESLPAERKNNLVK